MNLPCLGSCFSVHRYHTLDAHGVSVFIFSGSLGVLKMPEIASSLRFLVEWFLSDSQPQKTTKHKWQGSLEWLGFLLKVICYFNHRVNVTIFAPPLGDHIFCFTFFPSSKSGIFSGDVFVKSMEKWSIEWDLTNGPFSQWCPVGDFSDS